MKKLYLVFFSLAVALGLILGDIPSAFAQEEAADEFTLEEIVVTAQKREENQQRVPIAMEVISGEDLAAMGKNDIDEILKDIANVEISAASTGTRVNIRGLVDDGGVMNDLDLQAPMVSLNVDGSYTNMRNAGDNLFDIERVEVLFGPQSTMYGANAPGGIVNIVTASPKTDKYSGNASVEFGSFNKLNLQGALNVPVIQNTLALRLSVSKSEQGSWVNVDPDSKNLSVRLRTLWNVYEDLTVSITGNWSKRSSGGMMGGEVKPFLNQDDDTYPDGTPLTDPWTPASTTRSSIGNKDDQITEGLSGDISWSSLPFVGNLSLVPSYNKSESDGWHTRTRTDNTTGETTIEEYYEVRSNEQKGGEARLTNPESFTLFSYIVGGTYNKSYQYQLTDYEGTASDRGRDVVQNKSALFTNITYPVWFHDRLRLTVGYRQSWDESHGTETRGSGGRGEGNPDKQSKPNVKYGFEYDLLANMMLYGSYSSSYRSLNSVATLTTGNVFPPNEELASYTAGFKSRWFGNRLQVNLNAYYYDYANKYCSNFKEAYVTEDQLYPVDTISAVEPSEDDGGAPPPPPASASAGNLVLSQPPPPPGGGGPGGASTYEEEPDGEYPTLDRYDADDDGITDEPLEFRITDAWPSGFGAFTSLGLDLSTSWIITSKDTLSLSIAYLNSEWSDLHFRYFYAEENIHTDFEEEYPDFRYVGIFEWENYNGVTPANAPKWGVTASYQHNFTLGTLGVLTPRIDMKYKSAYHMMGSWRDYLDGYIYTNQEAYTMWDASAAYQHSSGRWSLNAYVKNLTDYAVKTQARVTDMETTMRLGDPRTYGATFSIRF